jgi:hypothetical protein
LGRLCYPTKHQGRVQVPRRRRGQKAVTVQGGYGTRFCSHGTNFIAFRWDRSIMFLSGWKFLLVQVFDKWALAQCRSTELSQRQLLVTMQDFDCEQMRVSGCNNRYEFVLGAGAKAKSVTNNLPIVLSELAVELIYSLIFGCNPPPIHSPVICQIS